MTDTELMKISSQLWRLHYAKLSRTQKQSFREQFKCLADCESDSHFRNMKNGIRKAPVEATKFALNFFGLSR